MIVEGISKNLAAAIKRANPEETASSEVLEYGLKIIVNATLIILITLLLSSWLTSWIHGLIALFSFALLRFFTGGIHVKSSDLCVFISVAIMLLISIATIQLDSLYWLINCFSLILIIVFAPSNIALKLKKIHIKNWMLKIVSLIIVLANVLFIGSELVSFSFFVQSLTIINIDWMKGRRTQK